MFTARVLEPLGLADSFEARSKALAEAHRMRMRRSREACASGAELHPKTEVLREVRAELSVRRDFFRGMDFFPAKSGFVGSKLPLFG